MIITTSMKATQFALQGLRAFIDAGPSFNPYSEIRGLSGHQLIMLEQFIDLGFELGMLPDLRPGWGYESPLPRICQIFNVAEKEIPAFLKAFKQALVLMLPEDEYLGCDV